MAEADTESADADDTEEREQYAWASQTPTTRIAGTPVGLIYAGSLDDTTAQNSTSFGVVLEDATVVKGTLFVNKAKGDEDTVEDVVDEDSSVPTDYRIADPDDKDATFDRDGNFKTDEESTVDGEAANVYEEADGIDEDKVIVWYNGLTGQRIGRTLDFNGRPFARWVDGNDGSYLIKGLLQATPEWRDNPSNRGELAKAGKAPRIARAPILRNQVEYTYDDEGDIEDATLLDEPDDLRVAIEMQRAESGRGYRAYLFDVDELDGADDDIDFDAVRDYEQDVEAELGFQYSPRADTVLEQAGYRMNMYTGDGWQDEPADWEPQSTSEVGSFGIGTDDGDETEGLTAEEEQFVAEVVDELAGSGMTPDEMFEGGISGLVGKYNDQFSSAPDVDAIREEVYAAVGHLSVDDLEDS